jgi:hypothetical protein
MEEHVMSKIVGCVVGVLVTGGGQIKCDKTVTNKTILSLQFVTPTPTLFIHFIIVVIMEEKKSTSTFRLNLLSNI